MSEITAIKLNNGIEMPSFGFGTWQINDGEEVIQSVTAALNTGYRLIDTAKIYGNENGIGEAIRKSSVPREEIFITTKLWPADFGYDSAMRAFSESLQRLRLDYIDLYLLHWPSQDESRRNEAWRALEELAAEGKVKSIGVSNFSPDHLIKLNKASKTTPSVNQLEFHPYIYQDQKPTLEYCQKHGIVVEAYSPLSQGHGIDSITIRDVGERLGKTAAQVMLRWAIQHDTIPIPRSTNPQHIKENFDVFSFEISAGDMKMLDDLSR